MVEQIAFEARESEYIDKKSGVSARLTISTYENLVSAAERRLLLNSEKKTMARIADLAGVLLAITAKLELVYEGGKDGHAKVAHILIGKATKSLLPKWIQDPEKSRKRKT